MDFQHCNFHGLLSTKYMYCRRQMPLQMNTDSQGNLKNIMLSFAKGWFNDYFSEIIMICFMNSVDVLSDLEQRLMLINYVCMRNRSFFIINKIQNCDSQILIKIMYTIHRVFNIESCRKIVAFF